jgi:hypothetical protein
MFTECPHELFTSGPRSSSLKFEIDFDITHIPGHEVCTAAKLGLDSQRYKSAHSNVQMLMLETDNKSVAVEVPLWLKPEEFELYSQFFDSEKPLTGHIDVLSIEQGTIWVWDFKPKAAKEKHAHIQTFFYAYMLAKRTGISLDNFMCGYFDETDCYVFNPVQAKLAVLQKSGLLQ